MISSSCHWSTMFPGQDFYPRAISARIVVAAWWLFALVLTASFTSDLTAYLTRVDYEPTVNSLDELTQQDYILPLVKGGTNLETLFKACVILSSDIYVTFEHLCVERASGFGLSKDI